MSKLCSGFCNKLNRNCSYHVFCNDDSILDEHSDKKIHSNFFNKIGHESIQIIQFKLGLKKILKQEFVSLKNAEKIISSYKRKNINTALMSYINDTIEIDGEYFNYYVIMSKKRKYLHKFFLADLTIGRKKRIARTGELLGYPGCCIESYKKNNDETPEFDQKIFLSLFKDNMFKCPFIHPFYEWSFPVKTTKFCLFYVHHACSVDCIKTIEISEKVLNEIVRKKGIDYAEFYFKQIRTFTKNSKYEFIK